MVLFYLALLSVFYSYLCSIYNNNQQEMQLGVDFDGADPNTKAILMATGSPYYLGF